MGASVKPRLFYYPLSAIIDFELVACDGPFSFQGFFLVENSVGHTDSERPFIRAKRREKTRNPPFPGIVAPLGARETKGEETMKKTALFFIASLGLLAPIASSASAVEIGIGDRGVYVDTYRHHHYRDYDRDCYWRHGYRHCW